MFGQKYHDLVLCGCFFLFLSLFGTIRAQILHYCSNYRTARYRYGTVHISITLSFFLTWTIREYNCTVPVRVRTGKW